MPWLWIFLLFALAMPSVLGQDDGNGDVVRYRYWYVPHLQPEVWPLGEDASYIPVTRHDFDAWVSQFEPVDTDAASVAVPRFRGAQYTARLEGNVLSGKAKLIQSPLAANAAYAPLANPSISIWFRIDQSLSTANTSNVVTGHWSLAGVTNGQSTLVFTVKLPDSISTELELTLPAMWTPTVSNGFVFGPSAHAEEPTLQVWRVILGMHSSTTLTLTRPHIASGTHQQTGVTETILWDIAPQGMQLTSKTTFDAANQRPSEFFLDIDATLRLLDVRCDEMPVAFTPVATPVEQPEQELRSDSETPAVPRRTRVLVHLPKSTSSKMLELEITAQAPIPMGENAAAAALWELPQVRLVSPSIFVRESSGTLLVRRPLFVRNVVCKRASQTSPIGVSERPDRDVFAFQFFDGDASVAIRVDQQCPRFTWNSGTQVFWNGSEIVASMVLDVTAEDGNVYILELPINTAWNIESVQWAVISPPVSWSVRHEVSEDATDTYAGRVLEIKLTTPLEVGERPRRLRIEGRQSGELTSSLASLVPILLSFPLHGEHCISIDTPETFRLQWDQLCLPRRQILARNNPLVERRFSENPDGILFPLLRATADLELTMIPQQPALAVTTEAHIVARDQELRQVYSFRCRPSGSTIDTVTIGFAADEQTPSTPAWDWRLRDETERPQIVRISGNATGENDPNDSGGNVSLWEVRFANPRNTAFEIIATRTTPIVSGMPIALPSVLSATEQRAELFIESTELVQFRIDNTRLEQMAPPAPQSGEFSSVRTILHYTPEQELYATDPAVRLIDADADSVLPAAWVWMQRLHSQFETSGVTRNNVALRIENRGTANFELTFPPSVTSDDISGIWVGDRRLAWVPKAASTPLVISIPLPERRRFVIVTAEFTLHGRPLAETRKLFPATPRPSIPVVNDQWIAWIPPEFVVSHKATRLGEGIQSIDFFLMPSSSRETRPFDPLSLFTWKFWQPRQAREAELQTAANDFITLFNKTLQEIREVTPHGGTWGDIVSRIATGVGTTNDFRKANSRRFELLIDRSSLAGWDVVPKTPLPDMTNIQDALAILDAAGLVIFAGQQETPGGEPTTKFYLTTFLNLACHRDELVPVIGETVWAFRESSQEIKNAATDSTELPFLPPITNQLAWVTAARWTSETTPARSFWGTSLNEREFVSVTPTWNAYPNLTTSESPSLYVVERDVIVSWGWLLCLAVVLLTQQRPFSHPIFLLLVIINAEAAASNITLCYAPLPTGVFLGGLFSLAISLVRLTVPPVRRQLRRLERASSVMAGEQGESNTSKPVDEAKSPQGAVQKSLGVVVALVVATSFWMTSPADLRGDWNTDNRPWLTSTRHEPYRVLIPVDAEQRVVGETIWVSTQFYDRLIQGRIQARHTKGGGVITAATYRASLAVNPLTQALVVQTFTATFTINVAQSEATVILPLLPIAPSSSTPHTATWDATPILPKFLPNDRGIEFVVENQSIGHHELEIVLSPSIEAFSELRQCSLIIPQIADTTLILQFPSDVTPPKVNESFGGVTVSLPANGTSELTALLGPVSTLAISWFERRPKSEQAVLDVDQLLWLWCRAHQTNLRAQWEFRIASGTVSQLQVMADPRFRLSGQYRCYHVPERRLALADSFPDEPTEIPITAIELLTLSPETAANRAVDGGHITALNLAMPVGGTVLVCADFVMHNFGGIGQIRMPRITPVSGRVTKSLIMTSCESSLNLRFSGSAMEQAEASTSEFLLLWDRFRPHTATPDSPQRAFLLDTIPLDSIVSIEASPITSRATLNESIAFDGKTAEIRFEAVVTPSRELFLQTLSLPVTMAVDEIEMLDAASQRIEFRSVEVTPPQATYQSASSDVEMAETADSDVTSWRHINLFLKRPLIGPVTIRVRGAVPTLPHLEEPTPLPRVELVGVTTTGATLSIYRTSDVVVGLETDSWMLVDPLGTSPFSISEMSLVGSYVTPVTASSTVSADDTTDSMATKAEGTGELVQSVGATPLYTLTANRPQIHATIVETLRHLAATETWSVQWDITLDIQDGEVAVIPMFLDASCTGALQVEPSTVRTAEDIIIDGQRRVVLMLRDPASDRVSLTITSAVRQGDNEIKVPQLQMDREFASLKRFVAVPTFAKGAILWEIAGATLADPNVHSDLLRAGEQLFVIQGDTYSGRGQVIGSGGTIRLLDVRFFVRNDGEFFAFATCDAEGGLGRRIVVALPPTTSMIEVSMCGITVPIPHDQRHRLSLTVGAYPMPQRIGIAYRGQIERRVQRGKVSLTSDLPIPKLDGITVQETLWTVALETEHGAHSAMNVRCGDESSTLHNVITSRDTMSLLGTLAALRLERMLVSLEQVPKETPRDSANVRRWFGHWEGLWNEQTFFLDRLLGDEPELTTTTSLAQTLFAGGSSAVNDAGSAAAFVRSMRSLDNARRILQLRFSEWLTAFEASSGSLSTGIESSPDAPSLMWQTRERVAGWGPLTSIESWSDRNHCGTVFFAGVARGGLGRLRLTTVAPISRRWGDVSRMPLWTGLLILCLVVPLSPSLREMISMTPHFWSVWIGLLFWALSPGAFGVLWIVVTLATLVVPLWRRRFRRPHAVFPTRTSP